MKDDNWAPTDGDAEPDAADKSSAPPIIVKKYANRRLYNTALSSYITLDDLGAMVRSGQDFIVQDAKTGADLTRAVLTQIIFEQESRDGPMLPVNFLRQLIRMYGDAVQGFVPGYLEMAMAAFERNQETFRAQIERSFGSTPGFPQLDAMVRANMDMFRQTADMFTPFRQPTEKVDPAAAAADDDDDVAADAARDQEIAELRRQLDEMQRRLNDMAGRN